MDSYDVISAYSSPQNGSKLSKTARSDASASGKRRIRNGACTFCREKKVRYRIAIVRFYLACVLTSRGFTASMPAGSIGR